jgi:hypothetical protein
VSVDANALRVGIDQSECGRAPTDTNATKSGDLVFVRTEKRERLYEFRSTGPAFRAQIWNYIDDRNHLHAAVANTLRFAPKSELADAWEARGNIDIEEILRILLKSVGPVGMKIAEANAPKEIAQIPLIIENVL